MEDKKADDSELSEETKAKQRVAIWTVAIPAALGLIGGVVSGGVTAFVQLSTKSEEYSINRAGKFRELMKELSSENEKTSRLAVLNLWQLYPDERDRRVITAAAFAVDQPDLVELVAGIDEKVDPIADMLHVRALSADPTVQVPALRTLISVDPVRAAVLLIDKLSEEMEARNGSIPAHSGDFNAMFELVRLAEQNDTVVGMIEKETNGKWQIFFDYVLYRAKKNSNFVQSISARFENRSGVDQANDYLYRAQFEDADLQPIISSAQDFFFEEIARDDRNEFEVAGTLSALKNSDFYSVLDGNLDAEFQDHLAEIVTSDTVSRILRVRAIQLLDKYSPQTAVEALTSAILAAEGSSPLEDLVSEVMHVRKLEILSNKDRTFKVPVCESGRYIECLNSDRSAWQDWLDDRKGT